MSLRPTSTVWFELLTTHDDLTNTLEALAHTGTIELELHASSRMEIDLQDLQARMHEYRRLERSFKPVWPEPNTGLSPFSGSPAEIIDCVLANLNDWGGKAQPLIQRLAVVNSRITDMLLLHDFLTSDAVSGLDYPLMLSAGPMVSARLFLLPSTSRLENIPQTVLWKEYATDHHKFLLLVGTIDDLDALTAELALKKNTYVHMAPLPARREDTIRMVSEQQKKLELHRKQLQKEIDDLTEKFHLAQALGEMLKMDWFLKNVSSLQVSNNFAWITGWTSDRSGDELRKALALQGSHAILHFPAAPEDIKPPLMLQNPWWAKPFEIFAGLLGTPDRNEADPSRILAVLAPLLFGYMFGDVGQGFILLTAGLLLQKRWPLLRILIANGASAILFGFVFGSIFGREDLIPALWLHPIEHPLPILAVPLLAAVFIMLTGLILKAIESSWRGDWIRWLHIEAPVIALYLGIVSAFLFQNSLSMMLIIIALIWFTIGSLMLANGKLLPVITAVGSLIEAIVQLMLNTVSFVRVGAFSLAHAGLSMAFNIMADNAGSAALFLLIMLLGNVIVILLEGLVVSIQTTRLILFEFFIRFLQANGRVFKPLAGPPTGTVNN
jgi:V/A-type H+-transporting ATPase subunit I